MKHQNLSKIAILILFITNLAHGQIARDIALRFLYLDKDRDNLLSTQQIFNLNSTEQQGNVNVFLPIGHFYHWRKYLTYIYPHALFHYRDQNKDGMLSFLQLNVIVKNMLKRHQLFHRMFQEQSKNDKKQQNKSILQNPINKDKDYNVLNYLHTEDYLLICDRNKNQYIQLQQFLVCIQAFILHEYKVYPYKIKSMLYPNRTIGYNIEQFKQILPKNKKHTSIFKTIKQKIKNFFKVTKQNQTHQVSNQNHNHQEIDTQMQKQVMFIFNTFEWPQSKIQDDTDVLIGPYEGKFMQPTMIYLYLDKNGDQVLDRQQTSKYFTKHGGQLVFDLIDISQDQLLDQAEVIAYFMFAMCVDDCIQEGSSGQKCVFSKDQYTMFSRKHQTQQAVCKIMQEIQQQIKRRYINNNSSPKKNNQILQEHAGKEQKDQKQKQQKTQIINQQL